MERREFIKAAGAFAMLAGTSNLEEVLAAGAPPAQRMNLLFITADDMNATMPGWMGNPLRPTPRMDLLAAKCHRFVNNHASSPICQPSRQAMMTGLVPHRSGGYGFNAVRPGTPSLATALKSSEYFIAALNKLTHMAPESVFPWDVSVDQCGKNPDELSRQFSTILKAAKASGKPFFINCNITDPHRPFYGAKHGGGNAGAAPENLPRAFAEKDVSVPSFLEDVGDVREEIAQYCNSVQRLDVSFGAVLDALAAAGVEEQTAIAFVSDHGMPFPFSKATVYTNGPWCPAILKYPGMGAPRVFEEFTSSIDLMPTLLDLLGVGKPADIDGRSWVPLFKGEKQSDRDFAISHVNTVSSNTYYPQRGVHTSDYALCFSPWASDGGPFKVEAMAGLTFNAMRKAADSDTRIRARIDQYLNGIPLAFYDLKNDPDQRTNVIADPQHHPAVERLQTILFTHMEKTGDPEFANYKLVLAGKPADIKSSGAMVEAEARKLGIGKNRRGDG